MQNTEREEFVNKVRERSEIVSVVSRYTPLNRKGGTYWGCCPFHNEKTPSFSVNPDKGLFYCFGCHAGGNVFNFISRIENISYFDAVKLQAERLGIPLPTGRKSPEEMRREREERTLFKINELARDFFHDRLMKTPEGERGRKYLAGRGITEETIENFKLGFAPVDWDAITSFFTERGFKREDLIKSGIVSRRKDDSGIFDRFRGRVMVPITDIFGHVVAFGGRILKPAFGNRKILFKICRKTPRFPMR